MTAVPPTQIELRISCKHLPRLDLLSKSDPQVIVYRHVSSTSTAPAAAPPRSPTVRSSHTLSPSGTLKAGKTLRKSATITAYNEWVEIGRTEVLINNPDPDFAKQFVVDYYFEEVQRLRFVVLDVDGPSQRPEDHDFVGAIETTLADIVNAKGRTLRRALRNPARSNTNLGQIKIVGEELSTLKHVVKCQFSATKLDKKDLFGKSDPFFVISRTMEDGSTTVVHRSPHIMNTLDPVWQPATIPVATLCNGDYHRQMVFEIYDWDKSGSNDLIGTFRASLNELTDAAAQSRSFAVINPKKAEKKKGYINSGLFWVKMCVVEEIPSFLDYIAGGTKISLAVAIDFTASNGDPNLPTSLHFRATEQNQYQEAVGAVGTILESYDSDKMFAAFGFGAKFPDGSVSHCFNLNGEPNPNVFGTAGILESYGRALAAVQLYGPTNFSPLINTLANRIRTETDRSSPGSTYYILLIVTDGEITDMDSTIRAIVAASPLPLSIVIVGVGDADFSNMRYLDGDDVKLQADGVVCERDIVQFVAFREVKGDRSGQRLAKEVLAEIPDQFVNYMRKYGIRPRPPRAASIASTLSLESVANQSADYALAQRRVSAASDLGRSDTVQSRLSVVGQQGVYPQVPQAQTQGQAPGQQWNGAGSGPPSPSSPGQAGPVNAAPSAPNVHTAPPPYETVQRHSTVSGASPSAHQATGSLGRASTVTGYPQGSGAYAPPAIQVHAPGAYGGFAPQQQQQQGYPQYAGTYTPPQGATAPPQQQYYTQSAPSSPSQQQQQPYPGYPAQHGTAPQQQYYQQQQQPYPGGAHHPPYPPQGYPGYPGQQPQAYQQVYGAPPQGQQGQGQQGYRP
ncbi:hypothetical protein HK104_000671 [Borealophlyctis nickersoniae]|nr:hypothetical protein HK104_000671 [Borealophlyctis nickersoniae]